MFQTTNQSYNKSYQLVFWIVHNLLELFLAVDWSTGSRPSFQDWATAGPGSQMLKPLENHRKTIGKTIGKP